MVDWAVSIRCLRKLRRSALAFERLPPAAQGHPMARPPWARHGQRVERSPERIDHKEVIKRQQQSLAQFYDHGFLGRGEGGRRRCGVCGPSATPSRCFQR